MNGNVKPEKKTGKIKKFFRKNYEGWLFNLPLVIGLLFFTIIPAVYSLYISLWRTDCISTWEWRGFRNFIRIFQDRDMGKVCLNTAFYVVVSVPLSLVLSYFLALLVNSQTKSIKSFRILYYLPSMIPGIAGALLWQDMMRYTGTPETMGVLNRIIIGLGGDASRWYLSEGYGAISSLIFTNLWTMGGGMVLWLSAFKSIDKQLYEAADISGANVFQKLVYITIPMSTPMIFYNTIMTLIGSIQYTGSLMYSPVPPGGGQGGMGTDNWLYMLGVKIYNESFAQQGSQGYAAALAWFMLIIIAILTAILFKTSKWVFYGEES